MDSKITPTDAEITQCLEAITRIQNLRYSFGLDTSFNLCRIGFKETNNRSQNQLGRAEFKAELEKLFSYNLKKEPPLTKKDLDEAALCLRSMFNLLRLEVYLYLNNDSNIMERLGYGRSRGGPSYQQWEIACHFEIWGRLVPLFNKFWHFSDHFNAFLTVNKVS